MRRIRVPLAVLERAVNGPFVGDVLEFAVAVDWPELRLTEEQVIANALALASGQPSPYPDQSVFAVEVPYAPDLRKS